MIVIVVRQGARTWCTPTKASPDNGIRSISAAPGTAHTCQKTCCEIRNTTLSQHISTVANSTPAYLEGTQTKLPSRWAIVWTDRCLHGRLQGLERYSECTAWFRKGTPEMIFFCDRFKFAASSQSDTSATSS